jgi:hypothetical protein
MTPAKRKLGRGTAFSLSGCLYGWGERSRPAAKEIDPMTNRIATYAAIIALSAATTVAAQAATRSDPSQDQRENQTTSQLNQLQLQDSGMGYGTETYQGIMSRGPNHGMTQEQIAQPPTDSSDLSIIE